MNVFRLILSVALFVMAVVAKKDSSSTTTTPTTTQTQAPTSVWVTGTDASGITRTTQSRYTQSFDIHVTGTSSVPSGGIGLGSISGEVGGIKSYQVVTISSNGANSFIGAPTPGNINLCTICMSMLPLFISIGILLI